MAISSISNQAVTKTNKEQKIDATEMVKSRPKMAPARSEDAVTVNISEEAQKKAQAKAQQNSMVPQDRKPSM